MLRLKKKPSNSKSQLESCLSTNNRYFLSKFVESLAVQLATDQTLESSESFDDILNAACLIGHQLVVQKALTYANRIKPKTVYYTIKGNSTDILRLLIKHAQSSQASQQFISDRVGDYLTDSEDNTTLIQAVRNQSLDQVRLLVEECGASVDFKEKITMTCPLHHAVTKSNTQIVQYLIDKKADLNAKSITHDTPVLRSCRSQNLEALQKLVANGANINIRDVYGNTAIHLICPCTLSPSGSSTDLTLDLLKTLLTAPRLDLSVKNDKGVSAFSRACENASVQTIELYLSQLLSKTDKNQPYALCKDASDKTRLNITFGLDYLNEEIAEGICHSTFSLNVKNLRFLLSRLESKLVICAKLKALFEERFLFLQNREPSEFNAIFKCLIQYDCFPLNEDCFYYTRLFMKIWISYRSHFSFDRELRAMGDCINDQVHWLISLGYLHAPNQITTLKAILKHEFPNIQYPNIEVHFKAVKSLEQQSKNVVRHALHSLSDRNLDSLGLPTKIKKLLVDV
jgi:ankyrin repeat protein